MAQLAISGGMGAASGAMTGSTSGPWGAVIGAGVGAGVGLLSALLSPNPHTPPPNMMDYKIMNSVYGKFIPIPFGTVRLATEMIWAGAINLNAQNYSTKEGSGTNYLYYGSFAVSVCIGPGLGGLDTNVLRIWADRKPIKDYRPAHGYFNARGATFRVYPGSATQLPNGVIQQSRPAFPGSIPSFRGQCYIVIEHLILTDFGDRYPQIEVEVTTGGTASYPYVIIGETGTGGAAGMVIDNINGFIYQDAGTAGLTKIDTFSNAILAQNPAQSGIPLANYAISSIDDSIYCATGMDQYYMPINRLDGNSLIVVESYGATALTDTTGLLVPEPSFIKANNGYLMVSSGANPTGGSVVVFAEMNLSKASVSGVPIPPGGGHLNFVVRLDQIGSLPSSGGVVSMVDCDAPVLQSSGGSQFNVWAAGNDGSGNFKLWQIQVVDNSALDNSDISLIPNVFGGGPASTATVINTWDLTATLGSPGGAAAVAYVPETNQLIIGSGTGIIKWDIATAAIIGAFIAGGVFGALGQTASWVNFNGNSNGTFVYPSGANYFSVLDVDAWEIAGVYLATNWADTNLNCTVYDTNNDAVWTQRTDACEVMYLDKVVAGATTLDQVVSAILQLSGLTTGQFDVTRLTSIPVTGYTISRGGTIDSYLTPLLTAFFVDMVETDWKLVFVPRGDPASALGVTISTDAVGAYRYGDRRPDPIMPLRPQLEDLPLTVSVNYSSQSFYWERLYQEYSRQPTVLPTSTVKGNHNYELSTLVLPDDQAKTIARALLVGEWTYTNTGKFSLSRNWLQLNPTNVITLTSPDASGAGLTYVVKITKATLAIGGMIDYEYVLEDPGNWTGPSAIGDGVDGVGDAIGTNDGTGVDSSQVVSASFMALFDSPAIVDADTGSDGFYLAGGPLSQYLAWYGENVNRSVDNGIDYSSFATISTMSCLGYATTALPAPPRDDWMAWDNVNTVTINPICGSAQLVTASSQLAVLNFGNLALLGNELIAFTTATVNADGTVTLGGGLLRGRRGTDPYTGSHVAGEQFVFINLSGPTLDEVGDNSQVGLMRLYQSQSLKAPGVSKGTVYFATQGNRLKPYTVSNVEASRDMSLNLTVTWLRQTRIGGENDWLDTVTDVPLGETTESYSVDIYNGSTVVRTLTSTSDTVGIDYTAAEQTTDFGSTQSAVTMIIYQVSSVIGRGFGLEVTV